MSGRYVIAVASAGDKAIAGPLVVAALVLDTRAEKPRFGWPGPGGLRTLDLSNFDASPANKRPAVSKWLRRMAAGASTVVCTATQLNGPNPKAVRIGAIGRSVSRAVEHALLRYPPLQMHPESTSILLCGLETVPAQYVGTRVAQHLYPAKGTRPWQLDAAYAVARTRRDLLMREYAVEYPGYDFEINNGYASTQHRRALEEVGPTPVHRITSALVRGLEV